MGKVRPKLRKAADEALARFLQQLLKLYEEDPETLLSYLEELGSGLRTVLNHLLEQHHSAGPTPRKKSS